MGLMGMKGKDPAADQFCRAIFDFTDRGVAIFNGKGKISTHKWPTHAAVFTLRHTP